MKKYLKGYIVYLTTLFFTVTMHGVLYSPSIIVLLFCLTKPMRNQVLGYHNYIRILWGEYVSLPTYLATIMILILFTSDISLHGNNGVRNMLPFILTTNLILHQLAFRFPHIEDTIDLHKKVITFIKVSILTF